MRDNELGVLLRITGLIPESWEPARARRPPVVLPLTGPLLWSQACGELCLPPSEPVLSSSQEIPQAERYQERLPVSPTIPGTLPAALGPKKAR